MTDQPEITDYDRAVAGEVYRRGLGNCASTHGDGCWALGPQHYDCALREIARQREVIETWREAHIEATGTDQ